ncbi:MAG: response regulator [Spirochaetales bacterium]|nr:response regulator [Spirochaetales bacterium]
MDKTAGSKSDFCGLILYYPERFRTAKKFKKFIDVLTIWMYNTTVNRFIFLLFSLSIILFSCSFETRPEAVKGVIDLSSMDFNVNNKISLAGEWEFYWNELLQPGESEFINNRKEIKYINVPSNWRYYCLFNGIQFHAHGSATYRLKLVMKDLPEDLVLFTPHILLSFRIFLNDTEIVQDSGILSSTEKLNLTRRYFDYYHLNTDQNTFFLTIQVQNPEKTGTPISGGIYQDILIGTKSALAEDTYNHAVQAGIGAGACFIMFFYHLFIALKDRRKKANLFLSFMCLVVGCMIAFFSVDFVAFQIMNLFSKAYYDFEKLLFLLEYIVLVLIIQYFRYLYNHDISGRMIFGFTFICFLLAGFILLLPPFPGLVMVKTLLIILIGGYLVIKSFKIFYLQRNYSLWGFPVGFTVFYLFVLTDMVISLFSLNLHIMSLQVSYAGFLIFLIINTYYLSAQGYRPSGEKEDSDLDLKMDEKGKGRAKELMIAYKKLKEQDTGKTGFFVKASHELRTPLTVIRLSIDEILTMSSGQAIPIDHPVFSRIQRQCDKLLRYVHNILDFSSLELNIKKVREQNFEIKSLITFFVAEITSMAQNRNLKLIFKNAIKGKAVVSLDFRLFETAFFNIISNSFKYTPEGGEIEIKLKTKNDEQAVELSISDTGTGIPETSMNAIFSWYSMIDDNLNKKKEGIGIGLAVTRKIIELHGGYISAESKAGAGSIFTIILPCVENHDSIELNDLSFSIRKELLSGLADAPYPARNIQDSHQGYTQAILIIDDEPDLLGFLSEVLTSDYTVFTANNGREGISLLKREKPDLVITDIMMPEMDGYEFVREIQRDHDYLDIPVLILTAKSGTEEKLKGLSTGAIDYIYKPFTIDELKLKIKNIMQFQTAQKDRLKKRIVNALYEKDQGGQQVDYKIILKKYVFTPREQEVFPCLARGLSNKEIGTALHVSEATVKRSVSGVYKKMGVNNRLEFLNKLNEELNR